MAFNFRLFFRLAYISLFKSAGTDAPLTPKRRRFLALFLILFPLHELITWFCFLLDEIFFPGYRKQEIKQPVFVLGNPRAGTTFLHRVLAKDTEKFVTIHTWEILLAPSIMQRKFWRALKRLDALFGSPLLKRAKAQEAAAIGQVKMHRFGLWEPEEDEFILWHVWRSIFVQLFFPFPENIPPYQMFDVALSATEQRQVMDFYRSMVQRHLYAHGGQGRFLSKNPAFTPKVAALYRYFGDARIVYCARNPLEMLPSLASWMAYQYQAFFDPRDKHHGAEGLLQMSKLWYDYPLQQLAHAPENQQAIVKYDDLVCDPEAVVRKLYERFDFTLGAAFAETLRAEKAKASRYQSEHLYSLEEFGYDRQRILTEFAAVFERFGFDTGEGSRQAVEIEDQD